MIGGKGSCHRHAFSLSYIYRIQTFFFFFKETKTWFLIPEWWIRKTWFPEVWLQTHLILIHNFLIRFLIQKGADYAASPIENTFCLVLMKLKQDKSEPIISKIHSLISMIYWYICVYTFCFLLLKLRRISVKRCSHSVLLEKLLLFTFMFVNWLCYPLMVGFYLENPSAEARDVLCESLACSFLNEVEIPGHMTCFQCVSIQMRRRFNTKSV